MSDNELALPVTGALPQKYSNSDFSAVAASGSYLPRLTLMTSRSEQCSGGKFPINHYALISGDVYQDLGVSVDLIALSWRPKALDMNNNGVLACYDPNDPVFRDIQARSDIQDSRCMAGPEFLVYIPQLKKFATLFLGSKSARRESQLLKAQMPEDKPGKATLGSKWVEGKKFSWQAYQVTPCTAPLNPPDDADELLDAVTKFQCPPKTEVEKAEPTNERAR
jgi:hypothetical protein